MCRFVSRFKGSLFAGVAFALAVAATPGTASARVTTNFAYTKQQAYSAALRFLRVDKGFDIVERDADAAYLIFSYPEPGQSGKQAQGTIEVIEVKDHVMLVIQLPRMPEYHEQLLSDGLVTKLKREYGEPPSRKPDKPSPKKAPTGKKAPRDERGRAPGDGSASSPSD